MNLLHISVALVCHYWVRRHKMVNITSIYKSQQCFDVIVVEGITT